MSMQRSGYQTIMGLKLDGAIQAVESKIPKNGKKSYSNASEGVKHMNLTS